MMVGTTLDVSDTSPPGSTAPTKLVDLEKGKKPQFQSGSLLANGAGAGTKKEKLVIKNL